MSEFNIAFQRHTMNIGYFDHEAFQEKRKQILVLKTGIAGIQYHVDIESEEGAKLIESLTPGTELQLFREPDNEHDEWAVAVYTMADEMIGYITRFKNETIARLMDVGKAFSARVDEPTEEDSPTAPTENMEFPIAVYMED